MATPTKATQITGILRIENPNTGFMSNLNVSLVKNPGELPSFEEIYSGASQTLLQKYLPQIRDLGTKVSLLLPSELDRECFLRFLEDADTNKAMEDIDAILANLPEEKRAKVLSRLQVI